MPNLGYCCCSYYSTVLFRVRKENMCLFVCAVLTAVHVDFSALAREFCNVYDCGGGIHREREREWVRVKQIDFGGRCAMKSRP